MKKRVFAILLLGGLMMIGLAGCGENKTVENGLKTKSLRLVEFIQLKISLTCLSNFRKGLRLEVLILTMRRRTILVIRRLNS